MLAPKLRLPADVIPIVVDYWAHVGMSLPPAPPPPHGRLLDDGSELGDSSDSELGAVDGAAVDAAFFFCFCFFFLTPGGSAGFAAMTSATPARVFVVPPEVEHTNLGHRQSLAPSCACVATLTRYRSQRDTVTSLTRTRYTLRVDSLPTFQTLAGRRLRDTPRPHTVATRYGAAAASGRHAASQLPPRSSTTWRSAAREHSPRSSGAARPRCAP